MVKIFRILILKLLIMLHLWAGIYIFKQGKACKKRQMKHVIQQEYGNGTFENMKKEV